MEGSHICEFHIKMPNGETVNVSLPADTSVIGVRSHLQQFHRDKYAGNYTGDVDLHHKHLGQLNYCKYIKDIFVEIDFPVHLELAVYKDPGQPALLVAAVFLTTLLFDACRRFAGLYTDYDIILVASVEDKLARCGRGGPNRRG